MKAVHLSLTIYARDRKMEMEVALQYNSYQEHVFSFVNNINTRDGGTHVAGFKRAVTRIFTKYGEDHNMFSKLKFKISGEDFREGLTAIISVKVAEPQFKGQTKGELGNSEVTGIVSRVLGEQLTYYLEENPKQAKTRQ
jgi:DNA gyrase subunit B